MKKTQEKTSVREEFNNWHDLGRAESMQDEHIVAVEGALKEMVFRKNTFTLDIGCGNGYATRLMAEQIRPHGKAYGVDISENMVNKAIQVSKDFNNCNFKIADFSNLPFDDNYFDIVLSVESIYYTEDLLKALAEVKRVTKAGGKFYCITYFFKEHTNSEAWADYIPLKMHYLSEAEYIDLFNKSGFRDVYPKRIYDHRPVDKKAFEPKWGYNNAEELIHFKQNIGALLIVGTNAD